MKDIYAKKIIKKRDIYKNAKIPQPIKKVKKSLIQKVEITNPAAFPEEIKISNLPQVKEVVFPETQKVEVTNPSEKIIIPETTKINNVQEIADAVAKAIPTPVFNIPAEITVRNMPKPIKFAYPDSMRISNLSDLLNIGDTPGKADPEKYIPVRLTNGKKFYAAMGEQYVAAGQKNFPFVNKTTGKPQPATVDDSGTLQSNASVSLTTTSGTPIDVTVRNMPTIQKVSIQDIPITTISGFTSPTPGVTTAISGVVTTVSGSKTDVSNFPTIQTVNVQNQPTLTSGVNHIVVDNFPTIHKVSIADLPGITTVSGSKTDIQNFPTVQTVNVQNQPTLASGINHVLIDNLPTIQSVSIQQNPTSPVTVSGTEVVLISTSPSISGVQTYRDGSVANFAVTIKPKTGNVYGYHIANFTSANAFLHFYDLLAANVVIGTSIPKRTLFIPPNGALDNALVAPLPFANNGIAIAATTTISGNIGPTTGLLVDIDYS